MIFEVALRMFHSFKEQRAGFPVGEFRGLCSWGGAVSERMFCLNLPQAVALMWYVNCQLELHWVLRFGLCFILGGVIHLQDIFFQSFFLWVSVEEVSLPVSWSFVVTSNLNGYPNLISLWYWQVPPHLTVQQCLQVSLVQDRNKHLTL